MIEAPAFICFPLTPLQALYQAHSLSDGGNRHVTVVDLSRGEVYPSKVTLPNVIRVAPWQ